MENALHVAHYISELLFRHDCVVVPGFGGFVCTYAPARIHPARHTFHPPGKQIVFNKHLQQNDGLLAQTISAETPCSFEEAMNGISTFAASVNAQLKAGKKAELHNIGTLSLDPEGNISFEAYPEINYLVDSFGLGSFQSMPVIREAAAEKRKPVERADRAEAEPVRDQKRPPVPVRSGMRKAVVASAILVPVLAAAFWFTTQNTNGIAGFGFLGKKEAPRYQPKHWLTADPTDLSSAALTTNSDGIATFSLTDSAPPIIVNIHKAVADSTVVAQAQGKSSYVPATSPSTRFYIVGGCFGIAENAERFSRQMRDKGYSPVIIDQVRSNLTHVGMASFTTKAEAEQFLATIRTDIPGAWILKK